MCTENVWNLPAGPASSDGRASTCQSSNSSLILQQAVDEISFEHIAGKIRHNLDFSNFLSWQKTRNATYWTDNKADFLLYPSKGKKHIAWPNGSSECRLITYSTTKQLGNIKTNLATWWHQSAFKVHTEDEEQCQQAKRRDLLVRPPS